MYEEGARYDVHRPLGGEGGMGGGEASKKRKRVREKRRSQLANKQKWQSAVIILKIEVLFFHHPLFLFSLYPL